MSVLVKLSDLVKSAVSSKNSLYAGVLAATALFGCQTSIQAQGQAQDNATRPTTSSPVINTMSSVPAGSEMVKSKDPLAVYRASGIDGEQERQIRKFAKDFEDQQKVRLKLMGNLLKEMRAIELMADPDEKKAMSKQGEINKVYAEICNERIKLLLRIRNVLTFEQKERLVKNIQKTQDGN